jgi:hypothetical protein
MELEGYRVKKAGSSIEIPLDGELPNNEIINR